MIKKKHKALKIKKPWPTKDAMQQIYAMKLWGDHSSDFYSGEGSHKAEIIEPYLQAVTSFLSSFKQPLKICDLGCGDFNIGKMLLSYSDTYNAVDIVPELIKRNQNLFKEERVTFSCLDIAKDELPPGDCALIRQVFQHLSNAEIQAVLSKLSIYKYVILTEHLPEGDFEPNKDIISGQGIRLKKQSGVQILERPFNFKVKEEKELTRTLLDGQKGMIVTTLFTLY